MPREPNTQHAVTDIIACVNPLKDAHLVKFNTKVSRKNSCIEMKQKKNGNFIDEIYFTFSCNEKVSKQIDARFKTSCACV